MDHENAQAALDRIRQDVEWRRKFQVETDTRRAFQSIHESERDLYEADEDGHIHLGGLPWHDAPRPRRIAHIHTAQTVGMMGPLDAIYRCRCGAIRSGMRPRWVMSDRWGGWFKDCPAR